MKKSKLRVLVLGAGFGGLEIAASLSERMGEQLDLTLIDKNDSFFFGYSKIDVMFARRKAGSVRYPYAKIGLPGVKFKQESITAIDPIGKRVSTENEAYDADVLVLALGADYDIEATPGLSEAGNEFYSFSGAEQIRDKLTSFKEGHALIAACGFPFKCPPAPSEVALLLDEYLSLRGVRKHCKISVVLPFELPIPPSYGTSKALLSTFKKKSIDFIPEMMIGSIDPLRKVALRDDGKELPFDLFMGIPEHCVPRVLEESGLIFDDWIPVDRRNLKTKFPNVYAIGDVTSVGTAKAGLFAEGAARKAAESIFAEYSGKVYSGAYSGKGSCYMEFGEGKVCRADVDFFSNPYPTGIHLDASLALAEEKSALEKARLKRWFGHS